MKAESIMYIRKGIKIAEDCLAKCGRMRLELSIFIPNQKVMDMLLEKGYLRLHFNSEDNPNDNILIFHNSEDKYSHNGDIRIICYLSQSPEVFKHVRKHKKVIALIKELNKRKEVKK